MPEIQAFRGLRYDLGHVGSLSDVVAPPYDVIDPELQEQLYRKHPCNVVRLILNRIEPGDDDEVNNRYTPGEAASSRTGRSEGVLFTEADPAIYVYHQEFTYAGATYTRRGFMARHAAVAVRRGPGLPARGDPVRAEGRPADADHGLQGEPQPGLRPLSRPRRARPSGSLDEAIAGHDAAGGHRSPGRGQSPLARNRLSSRSRPWPA